MTVYTMGVVQLTPIERFQAKANRGQGPDSCWTWTGAKSRGYGYFNKTTAYRWSYEYFVGPVPAGKQLDHTCHSRDKECPGGESCPHRACVNPAHLEPVTGRVNSQRRSPKAEARLGAHESAKTHCPAGHAYSPENTYVRVRKSGSINRVCRQCKRDRWARDVAAKPKTERKYRRGFVSPSRKAGPDELDRARELMASGLSLRKAAEEIGLSHTQLRRRLLNIN